MPLVEVTLFVLSLVTALSSEATHFVDSAHFGTFDFTELERVSYEVEIQSTPVSELQLEGNIEPDTVSMLSKHGQRYSCQLPLVAEDEEEEEEKLQAHKLPNVSALLQPLTERACLIKTVGWWTYEYCHGRFIRQYHIEAGKIVSETTILGYYERETEWDQSYIDRVQNIMDSVKHNIVDAVAQAYHTVHYVNGTECDITGRQRTAQAEIHCTLEGVDKLIAVKEDATCNYTLTIQTPLLCSHPMLAPKPGSGKAQAVSCSPVVSQLEYEDYVLKQELIRQQKERLKEDDTSTASQEKGSSESGSKGELSSSEHQLLRKLVMKSITQLAQIASDSLHDSGYLDDRYELDDVDIDVELELDTDEAGLTEKGSRGEDEEDTTTSKAASTPEDNQSQGNGEKVSDKMKQMANDVNANGKDDALESLMTSLLTNLAATAEYIESQEQAKLSKSTEEPVVPRDVAEHFETGEEQEELEKEEEGGEKEEEKKTLDHSHLTDVPSVVGPEIDRKHSYQKRRETSSDAEVADSNLAEGTARNQLSEDMDVQETGVGDDAAKGTVETEHKSDEQWELDPDLVKEMEHQMEETLGKQLDNKDIKVKIITIPESQLKDGENEEEGKEIGTSREMDSGSTGDTVASAVSKLIDKLLSDDDSVHEERQKQLELQNSYDQVWGDRHKERRRTGR